MNRSLLAFVILISALHVLIYISITKSVKAGQTKVIDSLTTSAKQANTLKEYYKGQAEIAYSRGVESQKTRVVHRTVYRIDTSINHRYAKRVKDSLIKAMFADQFDSSKFSNKVADGVLDLKSENKMLRLDDITDSTTIVAFQEAYNTLDSAYVECNKAQQASESLATVYKTEVKKAKDEARKQKILKWASVIGLAVIGVLSSAN